MLSFLNPSWPQAVILLSLIVIYRFGPNIAQLINRVKELSSKGVIFGEQNPPKVTFQIENKTERIFDSPTVTAIEKEIEQHLSTLALDEKKTINKLVQDLSAVVFMSQCEKIYWRIFGSQIQLLKKLNTQALTHTEVDQYFKEIRQQNLVTFEKWDTSQYISFLIQTGLIEATNDNLYIITKFGRDFLVWMQRTGQTENKLF